MAKNIYSPYSHHINLNYTKQYCITLCSMDYSWGSDTILENIGIPNEKNIGN